MWNFMPYQNAWWWRTMSRQMRRQLGEGIEEIE